MGWARDAEGFHRGAPIVRRDDRLPHQHRVIARRSERDGVVYQCVPQPGNVAGGTRSAAEYGYNSGTIFGSPGYLRVRVTAEKPACGCGGKVGNAILKWSTLRICPIGSIPERRLVVVKPADIRFSCNSNMVP